MKWTNASRFPFTTTVNRFTSLESFEYRDYPLFTQLEGISEWWKLTNFRAGKFREAPLRVSEVDGLIETYSTQITNTIVDAEENLLTGVVDITSSDLEFGWEKHDPLLAQLCAMRFARVSVPRNALILHAYLTVIADEPDKGNASFTLWAEATDYSLEFAKKGLNLTRRETTISSIYWPDVAAWATNEVHNSPDIAPIIQEVVSRRG